MGEGGRREKKGVTGGVGREGGRRRGPRRRGAGPEPPSARPTRPSAPARHRTSALTVRAATSTLANYFVMYRVAKV